MRFSFGAVVGGSGEYDGDTVKHKSGKPVRYIDFIDPEGGGIARASVAEDVEQLPADGDRAVLELEYRWENQRCKARLLGWGVSPTLESAA